MIDWFNLAANTLWIIGLALALAAISYASWLGSIHQERLRLQLKRPGVQKTLSIAGILFCSGLALTNPSKIETILWSALGLFFVIQLVSLIRSKPVQTDHRPDENQGP